MNGSCFYGHQWPATATTDPGDQSTCEREECRAKRIVDADGHVTYWFTDGRGVGGSAINELDAGQFEARRRATAAN